MANFRMIFSIRRITCRKIGFEKCNQNVKQPAASGHKCILKWGGSSGEAFKNGELTRRRQAAVAYPQKSVTKSIRVRIPNTDTTPTMHPCLKWESLAPHGKIKDLPFSFGSRHKIVETVTPHRAKNETQNGSGECLKYYCKVSTGVKPHTNWANLRAALSNRGYRLFMWRFLAAFRSSSICWLEIGYTVPMGIGYIVEGG